MALAYLGDEFDMHGGGLDLVFPHHENELAQSRAAGDAFARFWMHNALGRDGRREDVEVAGQRRCRSRRWCAGCGRQELRYYLVAPHYRSTIEYSAGGAGRVGARLPADRVVRAQGGRAHRLGRARRRSGPSSPRPSTTTWARRPRWRWCTTTVRAGNTALDAGDDAAAPVGRAQRCARRWPCSAWTRWTCSAPSHSGHPRRPHWTRWSATCSRSASGHAGAPGLRRGRHDPGPAAGRRDHRRGHPRRTAVDI